MGIKKESHDEIFETFHTGKGDLGTGLGLAVSKRIIENHHGKITVESAENEGAVFTVKLPTRRHKSSASHFNKMI